MRRVCRCPLPELLDEVQMRASIQYSHLEGFQELPTLFLEFHGSEQNVQDQAKTVGGWRNIYYMLTYNDHLCSLDCLLVIF